MRFVSSSIDEANTGSAAENAREDAEDSSQSSAAPFGEPKKRVALPFKATLEECHGYNHYLQQRWRFLPTDRNCKFAAWQLGSLVVL